MATLSLRISEEIFKRLEKLSNESRRSKSSFIKQMIEEKLEDYEDAYEALARLNNKNAAYLSTEDVEKEVEL